MKHYLLLIMSLYTLIGFKSTLYSYTPKFYNKFKSQLETIPKRLEDLGFVKDVQRVLKKGNEKKKSLKIEVCFEFSLNDDLSLSENCTLNDFQAPIGKYKITLLHYLTMLNKIDELKKLFSFIQNSKKIEHKDESLKSLLNSQDINGWTALHFSALQLSEESFNILLAHGADSEIQDFSGATPLDILDLVTVTAKEDEKLIKIFSEKENRVTYVSKEDAFEKSTSIVFASHVKKYPYDILNDWRSKKMADSKDNVRDLNFFFKDLFQSKKTVLNNIEDCHHDVKTTDSKVYLKHVHFNDESEEVKDGQTPSFGVFAESDIEGGTFILEYPGISTQEEPEVKNDYSYHGVDASFVRGYASYINECTPNVRTIPYYYKAALRNFEFAMRKIKKDEQICKDYLTLQIKKEKYKNLLQNELAETINDSHDWLEKLLSSAMRLDKIHDMKVVKKTILDKENSRDDLESLYSGSLLQYIFGTNSVIIGLFVNEQISSSQLSHILKNTSLGNNNDLYGTLGFNPSQYMKNLSNNDYFGLALVGVAQLIETLDEEPKKFVLHYIDIMNRTSPAMLTSGFILFLGINLDEMRNNSRNTKDLKEFLDAVWASSKKALESSIQIEAGQDRLLEQVKSSKAPLSKDSIFHDNL